MRIEIWDGGYHGYNTYRFNYTNIILAIWNFENSFWESVDIIPEKIYYWELKFEMEGITVTIHIDSTIQTYRILAIITII